MLIAARPNVSLSPGPVYVVEGTNVTLPLCHVTGHPTPVVTWSKSLGQLPQGRVQSNNSALKIVHVRKVDSDYYLCTAFNLLGSAVQRTQLVVFSLPIFIVKPPSMLVVFPGDSVTLNCSATGDPKPAMSWKRKRARLPAGRSHSLGNALTIRDLKKEDTGNYTCVATSADVSKAFAVSYVLVTYRGM